MSERWLPVPDFPGYEVSDHGRVRSYRKLGRPYIHGDTHRNLLSFPRPLRHRICSSGYPYVSLYIRGRRTHHPVHQLVAKAFLGPYPDGLEVCHNDSDPMNNRLENLRYDTHVNNIRDSALLGNYDARRKFNCDEVRQIRAERAAGATLGQLAKKWNLAEPGIHQLCLGKHYKECPGPITPRESDRPGQYITAQIPEE